MQGAAGAIPARAAALGAVLLLLAWVIATQPLLTVGAAAAAVSGALVLVRRPWLVWLLIGALLPFAAGFKWGLVSGLDLLLAGALALWFADGVRRRSLAVKWYAPAAAALVYVTALLLSSLAARDLGQAAAEVVKWLEFAAVVAVAVAALAPLHERGEKVRLLAAAIVAGAAAQAALGIVQFVFQIGPEWFVIFDRFMRASGTFAQPNPFAGYLGLVLPVALSLALADLGTLLRAPAQGRSWIWPLYWAGAAALIAAGLFASWSRGGWLGATVAALVVIVLRSRKAAVLAGAALVVILAGALLGSISPQAVPEPIRARVAEIPAYFGAGDPLNQEVNDDNFAVVERVAHWVAALRMFEQAPWLGVGPGNYTVVYPEVRLPRWEEALGHAHNIYLNVLGETGVVGLAAFLLLWSTSVIWLLRGLRRAQRLGNSFAAAVLVGVLGVLAHLAVHSLVDNLFVQGMYVLVALWLGVAASVLPGVAGAEARATHGATER